MGWAIDNIIGSDSDEFEADTGTDTGMEMGAGAGKGAGRLVNTEGCRESCWEDI